jgi:hypothetical protein
MSHSQERSHGSLDNVLNTPGVGRRIPTLQIKRNMNQRRSVRRSGGVYHRLQYLSMLAGILRKLLEGQGEDADVFGPDICEVRL